MSAPTPARLSATGTGPGCCRPRPAMSSCRSRSCAPGSFFPSLLERRRRIDRALFAVVMEAYVHGVSTRKVDDLVAALGVGSGISKSEVSPDLRPARRRPRGVPEPAPRPRRVPLRVRRRHLPQGPGQRPGRVPSGRGRHRRHRQRRPRGARRRRRRQRGRRLLDRVPAGPASPGAGRGAAGDLRPPPRPQGRDRRRCSSAPPGNAAGCTSCATCWPGSRRPPPRWSPPRSARSSPSPTPPTSAAQLDEVASHARRPVPRRRRRCSPTPPRTSWPSPASPRPTGARSGRPTRSSGSTARSNAAPTSSASSPTTPSVAPPRHRRHRRDPRRMGRRRTPLPLRRIHGQAQRRARRHDPTEETPLAITA